MLTRCRSFAPAINRRPPGIWRLSQSSRYHVKTFKLNTGAEIPCIGLGTFQDPEQQEDAVASALKLGYRHIDTARVYDTEKQVGAGIRQSGIKREEIFLTTKLWSNSHHPDDVESALDESLEDLRTDYVDLFLMHYPATFKRGKARFPREDASGDMLMGETNYIDAWLAMEKLLVTGKVKAIGMSNFSRAEMENVLEKGNVVPAVHQMELHPYLAQHDFTAWHKPHDIHLIQFSPFANQNTFYRHGQNMPKLLQDPILHDISQKYKVSAAQVALNWGISKGRCVIPKSTVVREQEENLRSVEFELSEEDIRTIDAMDRKLRFNYKGLNYGWKLYSDLEGVD
ncbi:hypothetical protein CKM354_000097200 [Cercospora kikuchii]|uniref:NADP-dependent oxidoreductase domain-containing protein n=1 Tax=Cercospora kikuchii TaxID=84275 RepID=A0A9P3C6E1_9PEZI|nr:uncharacterized protein CKM354_000097200 [Cercospora kikuchii]GIZ37527.1 hypothetical protein CKM354_000097200 [Cercospora kikuchii]